MRDSLTRSIVACVILFFIAQAALFCGLSAANGLPAAGLAPFCATSLALHALMLGFLLLGKEEFRIASDGRRLERVNLANILTLVRISTLPTILFLILEGRSSKTVMIQALALTAVVFLTDLLDGIVSRAMRQCTRMGRLLDSISDYCLLGALSIVLLAYGLIRPWFFWLIAGRLLFQGLGMTLFFVLRRPVPPRPTILGKAAVASTMTLYALSILKPVAPPALLAVFSVLEMIVAAILLASVGDKLAVFISHARGGAGAEPKGRKEDHGADKDGGGAGPGAHAGAQVG